MTTEERYRQALQQILTHAEAGDADLTDYCLYCHDWSDHLKWCPIPIARKALDG